ncbi:uncharacterized protein LOC129000983 [Macrosteles quadrilineatus]|uniref:uncharacterized protein LOC129000983 n=1 Tax=Macrosteles quadrilineatus TaxID=74068 RepID=UPI0023E263CB|nr:uncharacterized protein LOC129000983 [Macrosteles quadrilineatus]
MFKNLKFKRLLKYLFLLIIIIVLIISLSSYRKPKAFSFDSFNNITGVPYKIIPNTVHYVLFGSTSLNFISFLSIISVIKVQQSNVWIHCDCTELSGHYWNLVESLSNLLQVPVKVSFIRRPTHVYGQPLSSVYHSSDIARIQVLMENGGVYLDTDMVLLKPLDQYLHYEMVVGWPLDEYFGNQIMIGHPKARFLKKYLESYKRYLPREWYYNGGQMPTEQILMKEPHLVHRVPVLFGVHNLIDKLYGANPWNAWRQYFAIHLLSRHHVDTERLNETTILQYDKPFGEVARWILYQLKPVLNTSKGSWDEDLSL